MLQKRRHRRHLGQGLPAFGQRIRLVEVGNAVRFGPQSPVNFEQRPLISVDALGQGRVVELTLGFEDSRKRGVLCLGRQQPRLRVRINELIQRRPLVRLASSPWSEAALPWHGRRRLVVLGSHRTEVQPKIG